MMVKTPASYFSCSLVKDFIQMDIILKIVYYSMHLLSFHNLSQRPMTIMCMCSSVQ